MSGLVWAGFAALAALLQTLRNASQRSLSADAGLAGATLARFLFALPVTVPLLGLIWVLQPPSGLSPGPVFVLSLIHI